MELLSDVKDQLVEKITIILPLSAIESTLVNELSTLVSEQSGPTELYFKISDPDENMYIDFIARPVKLSVGKQLISFLNECPELEFRIN